MSQEKKFYVYVHKYASGPKKGQVFYVGKGSGNRAKSGNGRSKYWKRIASKYGRTTHIIFNNIPEVCAFSLEIALISFYGRVNLCNMTNGGEGFTGPNPASEKVVHCSNGMTFKSAVEAHKWLCTVNDNADYGLITATCRMQQNSHCGLGWSYQGPPDKPTTCDDKKPIKVYCSNGMRFDSIKEAKRWLDKKYGSNHGASNISRVLDDTEKSVYGFYWSRHNDFSKFKSRSTRVKPVVRSDGVIFEGLASAVEGLNDLGFIKASRSNISAACKNGTVAYGFKWEYATE